MTVARYCPLQLAYFAHKLTLRWARVDLNPHQVDAALFATGGADEGGKA